MPEGRTRWALAIVAALMAIGISATWYISAHRPVPVVISTTTPAQTSPVQSSPVQTVPTSAPAPPSLKPPEPAPALLYVHVAGAVRHPALYQLPPGSRVWHAVKAAGGATSKADLDAINLAQKVEDGEKVFVPTQAAQPPSVVTSPPSSAGDSAPASTKHGRGTSSKPAKLISPSQGVVDINTAGADTLERLPGIGPAMAERIIAYRQQAGRFSSTDELMQVNPPLSVQKNRPRPLQVILSGEDAMRFTSAFHSSFTPI